MINFGFKKNILISSVLLSGLLMIILVSVSVWFARKDSLEHGEALAKEAAQTYVDFTKAELTLAVTSARAGRAYFESFLLSNENIDRKFIDTVAVRSLELFPNLVGYSIFLEPNAFGNDADYANAEGYDATGRYMKWYNRISGAISHDIYDVGKGNEETTGFYYVPKRTQQIYVGQPTLETAASGMQAMTVAIGAPIMVNGQFMGVVSPEYLLNTLQEYIGSQKPFDVGTLTLMTDQLRYVVTEDASQLTKQADPLPAEVMSSLKNNQSHLVNDGEGNILVYAPVKLTNEQTWILVLKFPESVLLESADQLMTIGMILAVLGLVLLVVLMMLTLNVVMRPLMRLENMLVKLSGGGGDLTQRLPILRADDEIGRISSAFNKFVETLHDLIHGVKHRTVSMDDQLKSVEQVSSGLSESSSLQANAASSVAATIQELTVSIGQVSDQMQSAARVSTEVREGVDSVAKAAQTSADQVNATLQSFQLIGEQIQRLDTSSQKITDIVNTITDIAEQTNLLALNAAIEAARAGEQGRGFAVVADEVRQLATRSAKATSEISGVLGSVRREVEAALDSMESASEQVRAGTQLASEAASGAVEIRQNVLELSERLLEVGHASSEQAKATQEIAINVEQISSMTHENDQKLAEANHTLHEMGSSARGVITLMNNFKTSGH